MADSEKIKEALKISTTDLPSSTQGNGQNFIFILKKLLGNLKEQLDSKFEEISKVANATTEAPEEIEEQLKNCKVKEVRVGTAISLVLTWDYSDIKNYDSAEIYIKENKGNSTSAIDWSKVEVTRTIRTTKTNTYTVDGINAGYVYQIMFQGKNTFGSVSSKDNAPTLIYAVSDMNNVPDPPTEFNVYFSRDGVLWTWKQPPEIDYAYSELRTDEEIGNKVGLLEVTQDTKSTVLPQTREGTAYLYNKGYGSKYSTPLSTQWSKPVPTAPQTLTVESTFQGLQITYPVIPEDCIGICISINGLKHYTSDDKFNYYCSTGSYTVKAAYYDVFGEGTWTTEQTVSTEEEIPPDAVHITEKTVFDDGVIIGKYIGDRQIVGTKIEEDTITTGNIAANAITAGQIASNSVTSDKIEANAVTSDKIEAGAVTADKIKAGAVTADKLTAGAVTADKLAANEIKMAGALKVVGGQVTLDEYGLHNKAGNGTTVNFNENGMSFTDSLGNTFSSIGRFCTGVASDGDYVRFSSPWDIVPSVEVFPMEFQTNDVSYTNVNIIQQIKAYNISKNGFNMMCRSVLAGGTNTNVPISYQFPDFDFKYDRNFYEYPDDLEGEYSQAEGRIRKVIYRKANHAIPCPKGASIFSMDVSATATAIYRKTNSDAGGREAANDCIKIFVSVYQGQSLLLNRAKILQINRKTFYVNVPSEPSITKQGSKTISVSLISGEDVNVVIEGTQDATYARGSSSCRWNTYQYNVTSDLVIHKGVAGFIVTDPSSSGYFIEKT